MCRRKVQKMKIYIFLISCLCRTLAITVHYETKGSLNKNVKEYNSALKDIRLVPINQAIKSQQQPQEFSSTAADTKLNVQLIKPRGDKKRFVVSKPSQVSRVGQTNSQTPGENHHSYMQKMADQLYIAQKHASVLSDYQKFIINQDPHVKSFVLGQSTQTRNPKPFSRAKQTGRAIKVKPVTPEPVTTATTDLKRIVVMTPQVTPPETGPEKISLLHNEYTAQPTDIKYVSLAPQSVTHFVEDSSKKVALLSYQTPEPYTYYDLGATQKPQVETVQIPATISLGLGSYEAPQYHHDHEDHYADSKYEFMYKVKDHEKSSHFGHMESRTDKGTFGYYFVHLPDGRLETVKYWADKTGYHAKVDYQGEAKHPPTSDYKLHSHHNLAHY